MLQPHHQFFEIEGHTMNANAICAIKKNIIHATESTEDKPGTPSRYEVVITFVSGDTITLGYENEGKVTPVYLEIGKLLQASMA